MYSDKFIENSLEYYGAISGKAGTARDNIMDATLGIRDKFVERMVAGDIFVLGARTYAFIKTRGNRVMVRLKASSTFHTLSSVIPTTV